MKYKYCFDLSMRLISWLTSCQEDNSSLVLFTISLYSLYYCCLSWGMSSSCNARGVSFHFFFFLHSIQSLLYYPWTALVCSYFSLMAARLISDLSSILSCVIGSSVPLNLIRFWHLIRCCTPVLLSLECRPTILSLPYQVYHDSIPFLGHP